MGQNSRISIALGSLLLVAFCAVQAEQFRLIYHENKTVTSIFIRFGYPAGMPPNWVSPNNYKAGYFYTRIEVRDKTTTKNMALQWCLFQNSWSNESCQHDAAAVSVTNDGVYYQRGSFLDPVMWWGVNKLNWESGSWSNMQIVHKGPGGYYDNANKGMHFPYQLVKWETYLVAEGDPIALPEGWECQDGWECDGAVDTRDGTRRPEGQNAFNARVSSGQIHIDSDIRQPFTLSMYDLAGRRVASFRDRTGSTRSFNIGAMGPGTYLTVLTPEDGKVVKQALTVAKAAF
ncbi:MAG: hypothetical protein GF418_06300 [Chitinivibrionales bacterium]|nr:hypothetical protein [Chitinivibrionales bacterium]MBD3395222.1 hypothetical protein [Chitinivibrionales bacterium]